MSLTKKLWSLTALETETGRDRRTLGRALSRVPADGQINKHPAWFLTTALEALARHDNKPPRSEAARPELPPALQGIANVEAPEDMLIMLGAAHFAYRLPAKAAAVAALAGAPMRVTYLLRKLMLVSVFSELEDLCVKAGIEPYATGPDQLTLELDAFDANDWSALAEMAGEPVNEAAWERYSRERMASIGAAA